MRRRGFLVGLGGLGALVGLTSWRVATTTQQEALIAVLRKRLAYLQLDEAGVRRFADDAVAKGLIAPMKLRTLAGLLPLYRQIGPSGHESWRSAILHGEERITTQFLLSSDLFQNGQQENRTIHYVRYYDPLNDIAACNTPFTRPVTLGPRTTPEETTPAAPQASG